MHQMLVKVEHNQTKLTGVPLAWVYKFVLLAFGHVCTKLYTWSWLQKFTPMSIFSQIMNDLH